MIDGNRGRPLQIRHGHAEVLALRRAVPDRVPREDPLAAVVGDRDVVRRLDRDATDRRQVGRPTHLDRICEDDHDLITARGHADRLAADIHLVDKPGGVQVARRPPESEEFLAGVGDVEGLSARGHGAIGRAPAPGGLLPLAVVLLEQHSVHSSVLVQPRATPGLVPGDAGEDRTVGGHLDLIDAVLHPEAEAVLPAVAAERVAHPGRRVAQRPDARRFLAPG